MERVIQYPFTDEFMEYLKSNGKIKEYDDMTPVWIKENSTYKQETRMCHVTEIRA